MSEAVEYKIYWPKRGSVEVSIPLSTGWRLYLYRHTVRGHVHFEAKQARPCVEARWLGPGGIDAFFAHTAMYDEGKFFAALETWLEPAVEPLCLTLLVADLKAVWAYAMSGEKSPLPLTTQIRPDAVVKLLAGAEG